MPDVLTDESLALSQWLNDPTNAIVAHLAKNPSVNSSEVTALNQLTECDFPGYAPVRVLEPDVFQNEDPKTGEAVSDPIEFLCESVEGEPQAAYAVYLTVKIGSDAAALLKVYPLEVPFLFDEAGRTAAFQLRFSSIAEFEVVPDLDPQEQV